MSAASMDTGASHTAQRGKAPAHLLAVVPMMGARALQRLTGITSRWGRTSCGNSCSGGRGRTWTLPRSPPCTSSAW